MTTIQHTREFTAISPDEGFTAGQRALQSAGFTIWKTRPLAWFLIAHRETSGIRITANLGCRPGPGVSVRLSLSAGDMEKTELENIIAQVYSYLESEMSTT